MESRQAIWLAALLAALIEPTASAHTNRLADRLKPLVGVREKSFPAPGAYDCAPYAGIVLVPPVHPDERKMFRPGKELTMPMVRPELRLTPRGQKK